MIKFVQAHTLEFFRKFGERFKFYKRTEEHSAKKSYLL